MYDINLQMCLADDLNKPEILQGVIQRAEEMQDTSSLQIIILLLGSKLKTQPTVTPFLGQKR